MNVIIRRFQAHSLEVAGTPDSDLPAGRSAPRIKTSQWEQFGGQVSSPHCVLPSTLVFAVRDDESASVGLLPEPDRVADLAAVQAALPIDRQEPHRAAVSVLIVAPGSRVVDLARIEKLQGLAPHQPHIGA